MSAFNFGGGGLTSRNCTREGGSRPRWSSWH